MPLTVDRNATSVIASLRVVNDSGIAITGLAHNTAGLTVDYKFTNDTSWTSIPLSLGVLGTWSSGGFIAEAGADGWYQLGIPNAAIGPGKTTKLRVQSSGTTYKYGDIVAIGEGGDGTGILSINLTFTDSITSDAIPGVQVSILGSSVRNISNVMGLASLPVDPSQTYTLRFIAPSGYGILADLPVVVASSDVNVPVSLVQDIIILPTDPELCNVQVNVADQYGVEIDGALVWADIVQNIITIADAIILDIDNKTSTVNGVAVLPLIKNVKYKIYVYNNAVTKTILYTVPNTNYAIATLTT